MSTVNINLEDTPDGAIALQVCYTGGFNVKSHAHQHALLLIKHMDEMAERLGAPKIDVQHTRIPESNTLNPAAEGFAGLPTLALVNETPAVPLPEAS
jgi:hypothetical protein